MAEKRNTDSRSRNLSLVSPNVPRAAPRLHRDKAMVGIGNHLIGDGAVPDATTPQQKKDNHNPAEERSSLQSYVDKVGAILVGTTSTKEVEDEWIRVDHGSQKVELEHKTRGQVEPWSPLKA